MWKRPPEGYGLMSRGTAYRNLRNWMDKNEKEGHIKNFTKRECVVLIDKLKFFGIKYKKKQAPIVQR